MRRLRTIAAVISASLSTQAMAATGPCLSEPEMRGLILYAMPDVAEQLSGSCGTSLPVTAYLVRSRTDIVARYRAAAPGAAIARTALAKMAGVPADKFNALDDKGLRAIVGAGIASSMAKGIKPGDCRIVSDVLEQLAPLPPENIATLLGIALREAGNKPERQGASPFRVCGPEEGH